MGNRYTKFNMSNPNMTQVYQPSSDPSLILPYLYLGGNFVNQNPQAASYLGITHILNMAVEQTPNYDLFNNRMIKYKHIPADDSLNYNIRYHFEEAFELIDDARNNNGKILVHCAMGISRSVTIVLAYIMSRYGQSLASAFDFVQSKRPEIRPNSLFMNILVVYEKELKKQSYNNNNNNNNNNNHNYNRQMRNNSNNFPVYNNMNSNSYFDSQFSLPFY